MSERFESRQTECQQKQDGADASKIDEEYAAVVHVDTYKLMVVVLVMMVVWVPQVLGLFGHRSTIFIE